VEFFPGARVGMADGKPKFGEVVSMFDAKGTEELMLEVKFDDGTVLKLNSKLLYPAGEKQYMLFLLLLNAL
jgi:hypothetical protein